MFCQTQHPHVLNNSAIDALDGQGVIDELKYERFGVEHCGWKPQHPGKAK